MALRQVRSNSMLQLSGLRTRYFPDWRELNPQPHELSQLQVLIEAIVESKNFLQLKLALKHAIRYLDGIEQKNRMEGFFAYRLDLMGMINDLPIMHSVLRRQLENEKELNAESKHPVLQVQMTSGKAGVAKNLVFKPCNGDLVAQIESQVEVFTSHVSQLTCPRHAVESRLVFDPETDRYHGSVCPLLLDLQSYNKMRSGDPSKGIAPISPEVAVAMLVEGGLGRVLADAYFADDGDFHADNIALVADGSCVAFDRGQCFVSTTKDYKIGGRRLQQLGFPWSLDREHFIPTAEEIDNFPCISNEKAGGRFYWPTVRRLMGAPKNLFAEADVAVFRALATNPKFKEDTYFEFLLKRFIRSSMLEACGRKIYNAEVRARLINAAIDNIRDLEVATSQSHNFRMAFLQNYDTWLARAAEELVQNKFYMKCFIQDSDGGNLCTYIKSHFQQIRGDFLHREQVSINANIHLLLESPALTLASSDRTYQTILKIMQECFSVSALSCGYHYYLGCYLKVRGDGSSIRINRGGQGDPEVDKLREICEVKHQGNMARAIFAFQHKIANVWLGKYVGLIKAREQLWLELEAEIVKLGEIAEILAPQEPAQAAQPDAPAKLSGAFSV